MIATSDAEARLRESGVGFSWAGQRPAGFEALRVDSRRVEPGDLFCAIAGTEADGHDFVSSAVTNGAVAVVTERDVPSAVPALRVSDSRVAAAHLAALAAGDPAACLSLAGVTGTNGKTTTTLVLRHLLSGLGDSAALGTLGLFMPDGSHRPRGRMTTPGPVDLMADITEITTAGATHLAMEVSSHALHQHRVDALRFDAAVFTNLSHEHLDYHPDMEAYLRAKVRLLDLLSATGTAVVNADDAAWRSPAFDAVSTLGFGLGPGAEIGARDVTYTGSGSSWTLVTPEGQAPVELPLIGDFNVVNALGAAAAAYALGLVPDEIAASLSTAPQIPGRMEVLASGDGPLVLRDYAHTPDGLRRALGALRPMTTGSLTVVFGCGGDRDRTKRPLMGVTAVEAADRVIVTTDNPRTEDPQRIFDDVTGGIAAEVFSVVEDRRDAIEQAIAGAGVGDVVLLAGKGHETYQDIGGTKYAFDEATIVADLRGKRT